jgi:GTP-binding protein
MALMDTAAVSYQAVLTKADKIKPTELARVETELMTRLSEHPAAFPVLLATSSQTSAGIADLRATIAALAKQHAA